MTTYYVTSEELFGDSYLVTNIACSNYNPNIDGTITVTITVTDIYGDAVSGEDVTVTASQGNFTAYNGTTITAASSHTGTTDVSGQFTLTYTCSVWGLITFSANNTKTHITVGGWKTYANTSSYTVRYNKEYVIVGISYSSNSTAGHVYDIVTLPSSPVNLRPISSFAQPTYSISADGVPVGNLRVNGTDGKVQLVLEISTYAAGGLTVYGSIMFPR